MNVFIVGGTGFVGSALISGLMAAGHAVTVLLRSPEKKRTLPAGVTIVAGDPMRPGPWTEAVRDHDTVINLAGASIFRRWTGEAKKLLRDSRIVSTRNVVAALAPVPDRPATLINVSAAGYYGLGDDREMLEDAPPGTDFLARLSVAWEEEALAARSKGIRVVLPRLAVVLGPGGGALEKMLPAFRLGLGGRLGNGRQWFPWVHIADLTAAFLLLMGRPDLAGPVNIGAPAPVRNRELTETLGRVLHRPTLLPVPGWAVKLALGELSTVFLGGNRMLPGVLTRAGFTFKYPRLEEALRDLV